MTDTYNPIETMISRWKASKPERSATEELVDNVKFCNGDSG